MKRAYSSCIGCGSPCHTHYDCPEFRKSWTFEDNKRRIYELDVYYDDVQDYYPTWEDYCRDNMDHYAEPDQIYKSYEPKIPSFLSNQEDHDGYSNQQSNIPQDYYQVQCQFSFLYQIQYNVNELYAKAFQEIYQYEDDFIVQMDLLLSEIDKLLSLGYLSDQLRVDYLSMKCEVLLKKIQVEESISPLSDDIINCSQVGDELVEINTTSVTLFVEKPHVDQVVVDDDEGEDEVMGLPKHKVGCLKPIEDITPTPSLEKEPMKHKRKVSLEDRGQVVMKWTYNISTDMLIMSKKMKTRHVNYRTYIGNSVGKCSLRPP